MSRRQTMEQQKPPGDENIASKPKLSVDSRRENRIFGRDIMNLISQNYSQVTPGTLPPKGEKVQPRPVSVQRNVSSRSRRNNHSQDERAYTSDFLGLSPPEQHHVSQKSDGEHEVDKLDHEDSLKDFRGSLVTPYVKEIFTYLKDKERQINPNYMTNQQEVNTKMRTILVDWLVDVHSRFNLVAETLFLCINLIDRYLEQRQVLRNKLQLLGISALFVSAKYCEIYPPALSYFSEVTDRTYSKADILDMESKILVVLDFDMGQCTELGFFERYSNICRLDEKSYNLGRYTLELGLLDNRFVKYQPSMIASAAIYLAQKIFKKKSCWPSALEYQSGYSELMVRPCAKDLCGQIQQGQKMTQQAIQRKFSSAKYMEISKIQIEAKIPQQ